MDKKKIGWSEKINKSQEAKAWFVTVMCYLFLVMFNPIAPVVSFSDIFGDGSLSKAFNPFLYPVVLIAAIFYTYLHLKKHLTGEDVWKDIKFNFSNGDEDINESRTVKKIKRVLIYILVFLAFIVLIPTILLLVVGLLNR